MPTKIHVPIGTTFGKLTTTTETFKIPDDANYWVMASCECGTEPKIYRSIYLRNGHTVSCGCVRINRIANLNKTHGLLSGGKHPLYSVLSGMKRRCYNHNEKKYKNYGARGIAICDEWLNHPEAFVKWGIENGYKKGLEIDRYPNNDGNYEPSNCRWIIKKENSRRKTTTVLNMMKAQIIRHLHSMNEFTYQEIADMLEVKKCNIKNVLRGKTWT